MSASAYPLQWPEGWPRTMSPQRSRFDTDFTKARDELSWEVERMGGRYPTLSTNVELRMDGLPRAGRSEPADRGVAVYFERKGKQMVFACDRWDRVRCNMWAIKKTIESMRGIERWGASDLLERAYSAFEALPAPIMAGGKRPWWEVIGTHPGATPDEINAAYKLAAKAAHPDNGGTDERMAEINAARAEALAA